MFFSPDLLCKRSGKFAVIWTAAMKRNKLKRRDYESVDLIEVCSELEKLLSPSWRGQMATVQGFSLRLSAQLIHGVTVVYNMQITYLYKDINKQYQMLHQKSYVIDPNPHDLPPQSGKNKKQNKRDISQANINFVDPLFGQPLLPEAVSPTLLAATQSYFDIDQPLPQVNLDQADMNRNTVQDLSTITMQEPINMESLQMPNVMDEMLKAGLDEMGQPLQTVEELNMLVGENPDNLLQDPQPMLNDEQSKEETNTAVINNEETKASDETQKEVVGETVDKEVTDQQQEIIDQQQAPQQEAVDNVRIADSLCLGPAPERQRRIKKTKLKTLIVDKKTQLDNNQIMANLRSKVDTVDIEEETQYRMHLPPPEMLFHYPMHWYNVNKPTKDNHFNEGLCKEDEADVDYLTLFREYSQFANDPAVDEAPNNTDTITKDNVANEPAAEPKQSEVAVDAEKPAENDGRSYDEMLQQLLLDDSAYIPENERTKNTTMNDSTLSKNASRHVGRSNRSSMLQTNKNLSRSSLNLQQPDNDISMIKQPSFNDPSIEKGNLDINMSEVLAEPLLHETIIQENIEQVLQPDHHGFNNSHPLERKINEEMEKGNGQPKFSSLVPTTQYNKLEAAKNFYQLLVLAKQNKIEINQDGCFKEITIIPNSSIQVN